MVAHRAPSQGQGVQGEAGVLLHHTLHPANHKGTRTPQTHSEVYIVLVSTNDELKLLLEHLEHN